jgi:hypothetical protein
MTAARMGEDVEASAVAKLQTDAANLAALALLVDCASGMAAMVENLMAMADKITEAAGLLAVATGHSVDDVFKHLRE